MRRYLRLIPVLAAAMTSIACGEEGTPGTDRRGELNILVRVAEGDVSVTTWTKVSDNGDIVKIELLASAISQQEEVMDYVFGTSCVDPVFLGATATEGKVSNHDELSFELEVEKERNGASCELTFSASGPGGSATTSVVTVDLSRASVPGAE